MSTGVEALARALDASMDRPPGWSVPVKTEYDRELSGRAYHTLAQAVLAALPPADRLAIAGITEDRLAAALHTAGVDCNPLARTGGPYGVSVGHHNRASLHDDSARAILAALHVPE